MVEYIGMLSVRLLSGHDLIIKDIASSDPYAIVKVGGQVQHIFALTIFSSIISSAYPFAYTI